MTITLDEEGLLKLMAWSSPKRIDTRHGPRILRTAEPTDDFWELWRANKDQLKSVGIGCGRNPGTGQWEIAWWQQVSKEEQERLNKTIKASQELDATIHVPAPDGLAYRPYQKAGIAFALRIFGKLQHHK